MTVRVQRLGVETQAFSFLFSRKIFNYYNEK
nr:MAG TPA: hypothetical protein [Caudoviricetes sp.]